MKKLNIGFILLLCLFAFVPQIVNADVLLSRTDEILFKLDYLIPPILFLILPSILKAVFGIPFRKKFGKNFCFLVLIISFITNPLLAVIAPKTNIHSLIFVIMEILLLIAVVEWTIYSIFIKKEYFKLFLFTLLSNIIVYSLAFILLYSTSNIIHWVSNHY